MAFELHLTIPENSPAGQVVLRLMLTKHVTPEQAMTRLLTEAANGQPKTPAEEMWGAFSCDAEVAMLDEIVAEAYALRTGSG